MSLNEQIREHALTLVDNIPKVFLAGKEKGRRDKYKEDWDERQQNGNRTGYVYGYAGNTWNDKTFDPLYSMYVTDALGMFTQSRIEDLDGIIKRKGLVMDFSNSNRFTNMFGYSTVKYAGHIDTQKAYSLTQLFDSCYYVVSASLALNPAGTQIFSSAFRNCTALEELIITSGVIGNDIDLGESTLLNKTSIDSILSALSSTTSGRVVTLSQTAVDNAYAVYDEEGNLVLPGSASPEFQGWAGYLSNWTITLK